MLNSKAAAGFLAVGILGIFAVLYADVLSGSSTFTHDTLVWYGSFHYYVTNLAKGVFPYWDPYLIAGTPFYPNVPLHGLLDPLVLLCVGAVKFLGATPLTAYVTLRLARLFLFVGGAYLFYRRVSGHRAGSLLASGVLLFALPHSYFPQFGTIDTVYLSPWAMCSLLAFSENPSGPRRYLHLAALFLVSGMSMVVYVPSFFVFNLVLFSLGLLLFRAVPLGPVVRSLRSPRLAAFVAGGLCCVALMMAPPLVTMLKDASGDGELFPMQRIVQKNDRVFKQMMASDLDTGSLSAKFTNNRGIFNSWGNLAGMLTPDIPHWMGEDKVSYIHQYLGIVPLLLALAGVRYGPRRFRGLLLLLTAVHFLNGFSTGGVHDQPFNAVQRFFNTVFPPLALYQGRENFGYFVMLYLGAFVSMGFGFLLDKPAEARGRGLALAALSLGLLGVKAVLAGVYAGSVVATSAFDLIAVLSLVVCAALFFLLARGRIQAGTVAATLALLTVPDVVACSLRYKKDILQESASFSQALASVANQPENKPFQYFREPAVLLPMRHPLAFEESIARVKGALSLGFNHSLFTTKRYYDFFTHVPPRNQFFLNGMVLPVFGFYPLDRVAEGAAKSDVLRWYAGNEGPDIAGTLFVEDPGAVRQTREPVRDFAQYPDAPWLNPAALLAQYQAFVDERSDLLRWARDSVRGAVMTPDAGIAATAFSANEVSLNVANRTEGYLWYGDGWSRYWRVFADGSELPVRIGNYAFKAVRLSAGEHRVRFVFDPAHYRKALWAYYFGLSLCIGVVAVFSAKGLRSLEPRETTGD